MEITLHPEALRRFSEQAEEVRVSLGPALPPPPSLPLRGSLAHVPIKHELKLGLDTGDLPWVESAVDPMTGRYVHLEIHSPRFHLAVSSAGMQVFHRLVDQAARHKELRDLCSIKYVESSIIEWLQQAQQSEAPRTWGEVLIESLRRDVQRRRVLVPLEGIALEEEFSIGAVRFGFFTREYFERMFAGMQAKGRSDKELGIFRKKYQPYKGVVYGSVECVSEPDRAKERALEEVEEVLGLLRFFDGAVLDVRAHCPLGRKGGLTAHQAHFFVDRDGDLEKIFHEVRRWGLDMDLSRERLRQLMRDGMARVDQLLRASDKTDLQQSVLKAMALFSSGVLFPGIEYPGRVNLRETAGFCI